MAAILDMDEVEKLIADSNEISKAAAKPRTNNAQRDLTWKPTETDEPWERRVTGIPNPERIVESINLDNLLRNSNGNAQRAKRPADIKHHLPFNPSRVAASQTHVSNPRINDYIPEKLSIPNDRYLQPAMTPLQSLYLASSRMLILRYLKEAERYAKSSEALNQQKISEVIRTYVGEQAKLNLEYKGRSINPSKLISLTREELHDSFYGYLESVKKPMQLVYARERSVA